MARLREKGEHAGEVYHGTGDVGWEAAWPLMKSSPVVRGPVYVLVAAVSSSLVLLQARSPGRRGRNS